MPLQPPPAARAHRQPAAGRSRGALLRSDGGAPSRVIQAKTPPRNPARFNPKRLPLLGDDARRADVPQLTGTRPLRTTAGALLKLGGSTCLSEARLESSCRVEQAAKSN